MQAIACEALRAVIEFMPGDEPHAACLEHRESSVTELVRVERCEFIHPSHILDIVHVRDARTQSYAIDGGARGART